MKRLVAYTFMASALLLGACGSVFSCGFSAGFWLVCEAIDKL
jgi:hypothetical protein